MYFFYSSWGNEDTKKLIDILAKYNVHATFFVVGQWVDKYPESVKQLHDAGHEVMNHTNTHPHLTKLSRDQIIDEINLCSDKIEKVTGVKPNLTRVPYGDYNDKVVGTLREIGNYTIQWSVDSMHTKIQKNSKLPKDFNCIICYLNLCYQFFCDKLFFFI